VVHRAIAEDNEAALVSAIEAFEGRLAALKRAISSGARKEIDALLGEGSEWFDGEPA
jgi:prephenate dehydrogenase